MGRINVTARLKRFEGFPVLDCMAIVVCGHIYVYAKDSRFVSYVRYTGVGVDISSLVQISVLPMNIAHAEHSKRTIQYVDESQDSGCTASQPSSEMYALARLSLVGGFGSRHPAWPRI
jgi:hypothetical protein